MYHLNRYSSTIMNIVNRLGRSPKNSVNSQDHALSISKSSITVLNSQSLKGASKSAYEEFDLSDKQLETYMEHIVIISCVTLE